MNVPPRPLSPMVPPQPMGSSAAPPADESQNTSGILSLIARTLKLGQPWQNPYSDPAGAIIDQAIATPRPQMARPQMGAPGADVAMSGFPTGASPAPRPAPVPQSAPPAPPAGPAAEPPPGPGAPPPSVPEDGSENVGMGTGPGQAVSHDQAAGIAGGAVSLGNKIAGDPSITGQIIQDLRTKGYADNSENAWLALAQAGFAAASSRSPFALQALGEGATVGLQSYQKSRSERAQQMATAAGLEDRQQALTQQGQYQKASIAQDDKRLMQQDKQFQSDLAIQMQKLPYDQALKIAETHWYSNRPTGGSGGSYLARGAQAIHDQLIADNPGMADGDAWNQAISTVRGQLETGRRSFVTNYVKLSGYSLDGLNKPPAAIMQEANDAYEEQLTAANGSTSAPSAAPAPTASAAAAPAIPGPSDVSYLKSNPGQAANYDARFGTQADPNPSKKILGQ